MARLFPPRKDRRQPEKKIVVFYHAECTDGFTAAWVSWKKFGNKAQYIASLHHDVPVIKDKEIYMLDITFPENVVRKLMKDNKRVTSIDHHISNKKVVLMTSQPLYALNHSGCTLAWQYFFPDKAVPQFLLRVEDRDLWNNKVTGSRTLYFYLGLLGHSFANWSKVIRDFEVPEERKKILEIGALIQQHEEEMVKYDVEKSAKVVEFQGYKVYAINTTRDASEVGAKLYKMKPPFSIIWNEHKSGLILISLRGDGSVDCSKIAAKYGGGGHKNSAGFTVPSLKDIPWKTAK